MNATVSLQGGIIPTFRGWQGAYYPNRELTGNPRLVRDDAAIDFDWGAAQLAPNMPADNWSARWIKDVYTEAGTHRFTARADDGVRVYVDGVRVVDHWVVSAASEHSGDIVLPAGNHRITVEYFDAGGNAEVALRVSCRAPRPRPPASTPTAPIRRRRPTPTNTPPAR